MFHCRRTRNAAMFVCPNCSGRLNRSQNELGIFWVCPACSGRAVGLAVLRKAIAPKFINQLWAAVRDERGFPSRPCPACTQRMVEVTIAPDAVPFKLDVCKPCEFVWFDPGEMEAAPPKPPPHSKPHSISAPPAARTLGSTPPPPPSPR